MIAHHDDQRIAVGLGFGCRLRPDHGGGAGPRLDDDRLAPVFGHLLPQHAGQDVGRSAGREWDDDLDRLFGIAVRGRLPGDTARSQNGRHNSKSRGAERATALGDEIMCHASLPLAFFGFGRPGDGPTTPHAGGGAKRNRDRYCRSVQSETAAATLAVRCFATAASRLVPKSLSITAAALRPGPAEIEPPGCVVEPVW